MPATKKIIFFLSAQSIVNYLNLFIGFIDYLLPYWVASMVNKFSIENSPEAFNRSIFVELPVLFIKDLI